MFRVGERLRFSLLGFSGDPTVACRSVESALAKFSVPDDPDWIRQPPIEMLDQPRRDRLIGEVNELLFLWVVALDREAGDPEAARQAVRICDVALAFATAGRALAGDPGALHRDALPAKQPPSQVPTRTEGETSARGCFQWAILCDLEGRTEAVVDWLERATRLEPSRLLVSVLPG